MRRFFAVLVAALLLLPASSFALSQEELLQKIEDLTRQLEQLKQQMNEMQMEQKMQESRVEAMEESTKEVSEKFSWLEIGGDYRFRLDSLKGSVHEYMQYDTSTNYGPLPSPYPGINMYTYSRATDSYDTKNDSVYFNRFGLNIKARATENIQVKARLVMYKVWGHNDSDPITSQYYSPEKSGIFDGNVSHVPQDNVLRVDYAYATWSNIFDLPVWFSVGRRPSTGGIPTNIRQNKEKIGTAGVPGLLIDYAFDGMTFGIAPDIEFLPGFYAKICYGRGFDSGFRPGNNSLKDTDMIGVNVVPYDTDMLHVELQWNRAFNMMSNPPIDAWGDVQANIGDIDQYGITVTSLLENVGLGDLNLFAAAAISKTHPNDNTYSLPFGWMDMNGNGQYDSGTDVTFNGNYGLLYDGSDKKKHTGTAFYVGARYDIKSTGTKIGVEYNHGSKYWIAFAPASDDLWASKLGTRGDVYEAYVIQEIPDLPLAKNGKAFFRLGYQYYKFKYTGSNGWLGEPKKISELDTTDPNKTQMYPPLKNAHDIYLTFDVTF